MKQRIFKAIMFSVMAIMLSIPSISSAHAKEEKAVSMLCVFPDGTQLSFSSIQFWGEANKFFYAVGTYLSYRDNTDKLVNVSFNQAVACMIVNVSLPGDSELMEPGIATAKSLTAEEVFNKSRH